MKLLRAARHRRRAWARPGLEVLEDRLTPVANLLVSVDGSYPQQLLKEFTQQGTLVQSQVIPPGAAQQDARGLVVGPDGRVHVFNGSDPSYLSTYDPAAGTWSQRAYGGWSDSSYGRLGVYQNFVFATDGFTSSNGSTEWGIVRFNLSDGTAIRFAADFGPQDLTVGRDGLVYALAPFQAVRVYNPQTLALVRTVTLPSTIGGSSQFYTGIAVNANGDIYASTSSNRTVHRFDSAGTLLGSVTVSTSVGWLYDIDLSPDGTQVAVGSSSGNVALMSSTLTGVTSFAVGGGTAYVTFGLDPAAPPWLRVNDVAVTEGNTGTATATFTVSLSAASSQTVTVNWATANGTATAGSDYTAGSGTLTFAPGETTKTVDVAVLGDTLSEGNETFTVNLSGASGAPVGDGQGVGTILDDEGTPSLVVNDVYVNEGNSGTTSDVFTVSLSAASTQTVTVNWATAASSATAGVDYTTAGGTLTFAPGQMTQTLSVTVSGDTLDEYDETFFVNLSGAGNATIADSQGVGTICDDDDAAAAINDVTVTEGDTGTVNAVFTVTLAGAHDHTVSVSWTTADNTALSSSDYTAASGSLSFAPGETSKTLTVAVRGDTVSEPTETFFVNLTTASSGFADWQGVGTILDNDPPALAINDVTVTEGNSGTVSANFTVSLSVPFTQPISVSWATADGTAVAGSDYTAAGGSLTFAPGETSKTVTVAVRGDTTDEPNETFTVNLSNPANATIADGQGAGTITDDDAAALLAISDVSVLESAGSAVFTVSLSAASGWTVTVNYATQDATATAGSDYTSTTGSLTFAPGETSKTVSVPVLDDAAVENDEVFFVNLSGATNAGYADSQGQATILDDEPPLMVVGDATVTEGNSGTTDATFTVTLSKPWTAAVTVDWANANGTATGGSDYTAASGTLTFAPWETSKTFAVAVVGDTTDEPNETFLVNLSNPANATIVDGQSVGTITDDDAAALLAINDVTVAESAGQAAFTVSLSAASGWTVTVNYATQDFTATAGSDYTATSGTLTFAPGETSKSVNVPVTDDANQENDEAFFVNLSGASNAGYTDSQGQATILDDDPPLVSVNDVSVTEGDSGSVTATFTVTLSKPGNTSVWVDWATANGTATAGVDYTAASGTLVFSPGQTSKTLSVAVLGDLRTEADETFLVNLSNVSGAAVADGQGVGTITDDDPYILTVNDPSAVESAGVIVYTVTLSQASAQPVTVNYATQDYLAVAGSDYTAVSGTLVFAPGETVKTVSVQVIDDNRREPASEVFYLHLSDPVNAKLGNSIGNGSILDDDPVPSVTIHDVNVIEGDSGVTAAVFSVTLSNPTDWTVDLYWVTSNGTASYLSDYAYSGRSLSFAPGETTRTITVSVYGDLNDEPDETFFVNLSSATNATIADGRGVGTILTDDFPPVANAGPDKTAGEGAAVAFNGSGSTDPDGDALTYHWDFGDGANADVMAPTHAYADNGIYTATLTVFDGHGGSSTDTLTVTVTNVAPTAAVTGPSGGVRGQARAFTFSATDPSSADAAAPFTYAINWGDGALQTVSGPAGGVQVEHVFTTSSSYTVSATATDKDGGTSTAATQANTIVAVQLQNGDLVVGGTTGVDRITLSRGSGTSVKVVVNGQNLGSFTATGTVLAFGQAGNDIIEVTGSNFPRPVQFFGDAGNDSLDAHLAASGAILVGGVGDDTLLGGTGRDILIGGLGADTLRGGGNDDILIGGFTDHDANSAALAALAVEWQRTDANLATRISHLDGSQAGGLNGGYRLNATTVHDDAVIDELFGEAGFDWFIYLGTGANADHLNDWQSGDAALLL